jgi:hypothetical protein
MKSILLKIWNLLFDLKTNIQDGALTAFDSIYEKSATPFVRSIDETIEYIKQ